MKNKFNIGDEVYLYNTSYRAFDQTTLYVVVDFILNKKEFYFEYIVINKEDFQNCYNLPNINVIRNLCEHHLNKFGTVSLKKKIRYLNNIGVLSGE